jgi:hypothetical protein
MCKTAAVFEASQGDKIVLPRIRPMRLRLIKEPLDDPDYIFELKHDGFAPRLTSNTANLVQSHASLRFASLRQLSLCCL